jgi:hypothetical protein
MSDIASANQSVNTSSAEIIPFSGGKTPLAKEEYTAAIRMWCVDRSLSTALKPEEIGALRRDDRIDAQRKAILLALSHYYRKHERADVAPGVAVIIALLSDNEKGLATISQPTLATFFGRSRSAIGDAQKRLKDDGIIGMTRGRYAGSFPIIPREVTREYNHMTWLIEAINTQDGALNLPAPPADCQSTGPAGGLRPINRPDQGIEQVQSTGRDVSINRPDATQLHNKLPTTVHKAASVVAAGIMAAVSSLPAAANPAETQTQEARPATPNVHALADMLHEAAGGAINLTRPAMHIMEVPRNWMQAGCDLEKDILPTIAAMCKGKDFASIASWKYFEGAIFSAKAAREAPMPKGSSPPVGQRQAKPQGNYSFSGEYIGRRL